MRKFRIFWGIIAVAALIGVGFLSARLLDQKPEVTVSATSIAEHLSKCSSLTTARLDYRGIVKYSEGDIRFINQKSFSMIYDAHIRAGIDLSQATVEVKDRTIHVTVPSPTIQEVSIDSDSLEFYDEQFALFNWTNKEDIPKAISYAEEDARAKVEQTDLLNEASEQTKVVIETLFLPLTEGTDDPYTLDIQEMS